MIISGRPLPNSAQRRSRNSSITPPLRGSRRSRAAWRRLMRWGVRTRRAKGEILCAVAVTAGVCRLRWGSRRSRAEWRRLMRWGANAAPPNGSAADAVGGQTPAHQTALRSQLAGLRSSQFPVRQMGPLPRSRLLTRIPDGRDRIGHISWSSTQTRDGSRVAATETAPTSPGGIES